MTRGPLSFGVISIASAGAFATVGCLLLGHDLDELTSGTGRTDDPFRDGSTDGASPGDEHEASSGSCNTAGVDIILDAAGVAVSRALAFPSAPKQTRFADVPSGGPCPMTLDVDTKVPVRAFVVQNTLARRATLSAWAVCVSNFDDAFLTFYRRATPPVTDDEISDCTFWVSEGAKGTGSFDSPEPADAVFCPGLTASNNGGLLLDPCEVVVVYVQQVHPEKAPQAPPVLRIQLD